MKKLDYESNVAKIISDEENGYVLLQWMSPVVHVEYKQTVEQLLKIIVAKKLTKFIADIRVLGALDDESIKYSNRVMVPAMENVRKMATIVPQDIFDKMISESLMEKLSANNQVHSFRSQEEAEAWMKKP